MARRGFSLVEMLVVLAITALVLSLLASAYVMELRAIRSAKGLIEMDEQLTAAERQIRYYLRLPHFEGNRRVSEIGSSWTPSEGYFEVSGGSSDPATSDWMRFTVRLPANRPNEWFATGVPVTNTAGEAYHPLTGVPLYKYPTSPVPPPATPPSPPLYLAQWLEVAFFLSQQMDPDDPTNKVQMATVPLDHPGYGNAAKLYRLHLRKAALVPRRLSYPGKQPIDIETDINNGRLDFSVPVTPSPYELSTFPTPTPPNYRPNTTQSVQSDPSKRLATQPSGDGRDILVSNVVSFDIRLFFSGSSTAQDSSWDDSLGGSSPAPSGLEIRIRVFNPKTQQMRDIVIVESL
jgi:prepilin-type N-terminal cleavage/methylation domain-containing protein